MAASSRLQAWLTQQMAAGLPALAGARVSAQVPVQVSLLNDLIAEVLADARTGAAASPKGEGPPVDLATVARLVREVRVEAGPGTITLKVEAGVDG